MSEKQMVRVFREGVKSVDWAKIHWQRFEDRHSPGIPDVAIGTEELPTAWIECKYSAKYATKGRVQQLPHFSLEQRKWLSRWPRTWLLWRIERDWYLFSDDFDLLGHVPPLELVDLADRMWGGTPNWDLMTRRLLMHNGSFSQ